MPGICVTALRIREKDQAAAKAAAGASWVQVGLVFTTRAGTPFEPRNLNRRFETRCAKAGVRRIIVHHMRHTCATLQFPRSTCIPGLPCGSCGMRRST